MPDEEIIAFLKVHLQSIQDNDVQTSGSRTRRVAAGPAAACLILHDDRLAEFTLQLIGEKAGNAIGSAASCPRTDDDDGPIGVVCSCGRTGTERNVGQRRDCN